ncbi:MAG: hypothetical protein MUF84_05215, partial [Anaerolineae bacterium]|nr:hypothetical protein [Anaerolineae bacterium]
APERVRAELVALVALPAAATALALLVELGLVDHTLPELEQAASQVAEPRSDRLAEAAGRIRVVAALIRQLESVERWPLEVPARAAFARALADTSPPSLTGLKAYLSEQMGAETARATLVRWAALFAPLTLSPDQGTGTLAARNRLSALRFSRAAIEFVGLVLASRGAFENVASVGTLTETDYGSDPEARRTIYRYYRDARAAGVAGALLALAISETRHIYPSPECSPAYVATARTMVQAYFTQRGSWIDPAPLLSGHDLMALGVAPGRPVGTAAALLREAQAVGAVSTVAQARALVLRAVQGGDCLSLLAPGGPA